MNGISHHHMPKKFHLWMKVAFRLVSDMVKELVPWSYDHKKVWLLPNEEQLKSAEQKKSADHAFPNLPEFSATACLRSG
jgi:hypothetical protein